MLIQTCRRLLLPALLLLAAQAQAQARLNLRLEAGANHGQPLVLWARQTFPGTTPTFDTLTFQQGRSSLRLNVEKAEEAPYAHLYTLFPFPVDSVRGRLVTVSAWVRTSGFEGWAGFIRPPRRLFRRAPVRPGSKRFGCRLSCWTCARWS